ncbi:MAG TPA: sialidase family protein [Vicinamibacterales bacterium]|nr:sialidase family protein [Vicinamibacterales bacterium]
MKQLVWYPALAGLLLVVTTLSASQSPVLSPQPVPTPANANSAQPQLSISKRGVLLSWIERTGDLATMKFAERTASGWTTPRTIASGRDWFVNWADVPSALRLPSGAIVAHWLQKSGPSTYAYDVRLSHSTDDGKTWSPSYLPHSDGTQTEHGFASLFPMGDGFGLVWLDGRAMKAGGGHGGEHGGGGAMTVRFGQFDKHFKQVSETAVDAKVCECCPTAAAVTTEGVIAAYRDRSDAEIRDNYVARLVNGKWLTPKPVFNDNWKIAACPVNGPALAASGRTVVMTWFTARQDQGQAYLAFSDDAGATFASPIRLDDGGTLGRVDVELLPDGAALATWIEFADQPVPPKPLGGGGRAQFRARRIERNGRRSAPVTISGMAGNRSSGYPRAAVANGEIVFAWTESADGGALHVRTAVARIP